MNIAGHGCGIIANRPRHALPERPACGPGRFPRRRRAAIRGPHRPAGLGVMPQPACRVRVTSRGGAIVSARQDAAVSLSRRRERDPCGGPPAAHDPARAGSPAARAACTWTAFRGRPLRSRGAISGNRATPRRQRGRAIGMRLALDVSAQWHDDDRASSRPVVSARSQAPAGRRSTFIVTHASCRGRCIPEDAPPTARIEETSRGLAPGAERER